MSTTTWFENAIRVGLVAYGIMHILIGWLGLQLALGDRQGAPNQQGALHILAQQPGGAVLLWITGLGLFVLSLWQLLEALWGHTKDQGGMRALERIGSVGKVVLYAVLGYSALKTAAAGSSTTNEHSLTRKLLQLPVGQLIVMAIGTVIVAVAAILAHRGLTTSFDKRLRPGALTGRAGPVVKRLGQVGYIAKGVAFAVLGGLFFLGRRNLQRQPDRRTRHRPPHPPRHQPRALAADNHRSRIRRLRPLLLRLGPIRRHTKLTDKGRPPFFAVSLD